MDFWIDFASFAIKSIWIVFIIGALAGFIVLIALHGDDEEDEDGELKIVDLNERYDRMERSLAENALSKKAFKKFVKAHDKARIDDETRKRVYVIDFDGSSEKKELESLGRKITAILTIARPKRDEVVARIESPGGAVTVYGLAAMQMQRIRDAEISLTVCVDQVAASGGYLMAVPANKILASPFAVLGSIGVVAQLPNIHRLLKKIDVDYEELTAGAHKRPVSIFGAVTEEGREHYRSKLEDMHGQFKSFVKRYRPDLDLTAVANGDFWSGSEALDLHLIDEIASSDDYLFSQRKSARIFLLKIEQPQSFVASLLKNFGFSALGKLTSRFL